MCTGAEAPVAAEAGTAMCAAGAADALATGGADAATSAAWGSGAGLGGDTLTAMGAAEGAGAGTAAAGAAGAGSGAAEGIGTLAQDSATKAALYGAEGYGPAATPFELQGGEAGLMSSLNQGLQYANEANNLNNFAKNPNLQTGLNLGMSTAGLVGDTSGNIPSTSASAPTGAGAGAEVPGVSNPLTDAATAAPTGTPTAAAPDFGPPVATSSELGGAAPAATPTAPTTVPQDKGVLDWMGNNKLQTANLGLGTASLLNNMRQGNIAQKQFQGVAANSKAASDQLLAQYKSGQITGADSFAIADWTQKQKAQTDQYFAKAGLSNSSMHQQAMQQIDAQAEGMRQQALQNMLKNGLSAAGVSDPTLRAGITAGMQNDQYAMKQMQDFISTLAGMNTQKNSQTGSATTPPPGG